MRVRARAKEREREGETANHELQIFPHRTQPRSTNTNFTDTVSPAARGCDLSVHSPCLANNDCNVLIAQPPITLPIPRYGLLCSTHAGFRGLPSRGEGGWGVEFGGSWVRGFAFGSRMDTL